MPRPGVAMCGAVASLSQPVRVNLVPLSRAIVDR